MTINDEVKAKQNIPLTARLTARTKQGLTKADWEGGRKGWCKVKPSKLLVSLICGFRLNAK